MCQLLEDLQNMLNEIQTQEFASVEELKEKLQNVQDIVNVLIAENC